MDNPTKKKNSVMFMLSDRSIRSLADSSLLNISVTYILLALLHGLAARQFPQFEYWLWANAIKHSALGTLVALNCVPNGFHHVINLTNDALLIYLVFIHSPTLAILQSAIAITLFVFEYYMLQHNFNRQLVIIAIACLLCKFGILLVQPYYIWCLCMLVPTYNF